MRGGQIGGADEARILVPTQVWLRVDLRENRGAVLTITAASHAGSI